MKQMFKARLIFIFILLLKTIGFAQTQQPAYSSNENNLTDTILYTHEIVVSADTVNAWKSDKAFAYVNNLDSLLKIREKKFLSKTQPVPTHNAPSILQQFFSSSIVQFIF